jgi:hypothetical protein
VRLPRHPRPIGAGLAQVIRELPETLRERRSIKPSRALTDWFLAGQGEEGGGYPSTP